MPTYNTLINRDNSNDPLVPVEVAQDIIKEAVNESVVLTHGRKVAMSSQTHRQPVLATKPAGYFVSGDTGLKQTSTADWTNVDLVAEEIAVLIPIPDAYAADANVDIWGEVKPLVAEAFGKVLDAACLFGVNKPSTWSAAVVPAAVAAGNTVEIGAGSTDLAANIAAGGELVAQDGYAVNGFAAAPGFNWKLAQLRTTDGQSLYLPDLTAAGSGKLYGLPVKEVMNGSWDADEALLLGGDWSKVMVGVRQDITFTKHDSGIISDASGAVVFNAMQQDSTIYRAVFRVAFATAKPATSVAGTSGYPFFVVTPVAE